MAEDLATYDQVQTGDPDPLGLDKRLAQVKSKSDPLGLDARLQSIKQVQVTQQPKVNQPTFQPMDTWLNIQPQQGYQPLDKANVVNDHTVKTQESTNRIKSHLADIDQSVHNLISDYKKNIAGQSQMTQLAINKPFEAAPLNMQAKELESKLRPTIEVHPDEVADYKAVMNNNPVMFRQALEQKAKDLSKTNHLAANQLKADIYRVDAQNRPEKEKKISENVEKINNGDLDYDVKKGFLVKPEGFWGSLATSFKQKTQAFDDYDVFKSGNEKDILNLIKKRTGQDPDEPTPVPVGATAEAGSMLGGQPLKPLIGAGIAGYFGGPEAGAAAMSAISAPEMYKLSFGSSLPQNFDAIKKQHPDLSDSEVLQQAIDLSHKQANTDALTGAAMGAVGAKFGFESTGLGSGLLKKSVGSALKQIGEEGAKKTLEGVGVGAIGGAGQYVKNIMAQKAGIPTDEMKGVPEQLKAGIAMTAGITLVAKASNLIKPSTYNKLLHGLSKAPEEAVNYTINDLQQQGHITPDEAQKAQTDIASQKKIDGQIPTNIPEPDRLKIQQKIKERNDLKSQLETVHEAYHPDIKEKIKKIDEDILNISKGSEHGELQSIVAKSKIEGPAAEYLNNLDEKELKSALKEIAEQAHDPNSANQAVITFGEDIVNKAKELYPKEDPNKESKIKEIERKRQEELRRISESGEDEENAMNRINQRIQIDAKYDAKLAKEDGAGKLPPEQIGHVEVSEHGEDTKTAAKQENGTEPSKLSPDGVKEAEDLGQYLKEKGKTKIITSEVKRAQETAKIAGKEASIPVETNPLLNTWNIGKYDGKPEGSFVEEAWANKPNEAPEGGESFNDFTKRMEQAYQMVKSLPEDNHVVSHSKVMRALDALEKTDGKWTNETTKDFLTNKELSNAVPIEKPNALDVRQQAGNGPTMGSGNAEPQVTPGQEGGTTKEESVNKGQEKVEMFDLPFTFEKGEYKVEEPKNIGITHRQMDAIANEFGFDTYEKSPEKVKEWDEQAAKKLQQPNALYDLFTKLRNGDIPDKVETRMMLQYMADLMAKIDKAPMDESLLQQLKRTKDLFNIAGREQGKALAARKGTIPVEETLGDFLIRDMEANKAPLTEQQKETSINEYNKIKEATEKYEKELERVRAENNKLKAEKEVKKVTAKTKKQPKKDYSAERKEIVNDIREKLRKARGETSVVAVPYAKELIAIAPDVAKLVKSLVEEGIEKLPDIIKNVHGTLKEFIPEITEKDIHNIIAGEYNDKKTRTELAEKLYNIKLQAKLINKLEGLQAGIQPKNEKQRIRRNQEIETLRQQIKDLTERPERTDEQKLTALKTRYKTETAKLEEQLRTGDFAEVEKGPIKLDKEAQDAKEKLWKLKQEREVRLIKEKYKNQSTFDKGKDAVTNVLNAPRSIMSSMDYSAPLRQGLVASVAHPTLAAKALKYMFKASVSQKEFDRWFMDLKDSPDYHEMVNSGLALADPHDPTATAHEEAFMSQLPERIPGIGRLIKGSERAYTGFLNKMRVDSYRRLTDAFKSDGKTFENSPALYKATAEYVNATTGRGSLPETIERAAPLLNSLFFSPRLIASRLQLLTNPLNPFFYKNVPKEVRVQYFKDMAKFVVAGTTILALAHLGGAHIETDPRSSDFGKIKSGDTRWDIWGGFQQYVRFITQMISGERKAATSGEVTELSGKGRFGETRADVVSRFARGKLAPVPATLWDLLSGRTVVGEKLHYSFTEPTEGRDINLTDEAKKNLLPLIYSDIKDAWQQQGASSILTVGIPSTFGVGTQTFTDNNSGGSSGGAGATRTIQPSRQSINRTIKHR